MELHEMRAAIGNASGVLRHADIVSNEMLDMLVGRLRQTGDLWRTIANLRCLKRELRDFNMTTGTWNE